MARTLPEILASVNDRVSALDARLRAAEQENARLRARLEDTESRLDEARSERDRAMLDVEFLTLSHRLADTPEALLSARRRISRMIRTIDKCILLLKDDPAI
ncbi:MAG: hypothetical protein K2O24_03525 [Muribaculaceae bacterium]|nr:hypothetical protein [Muribaculaceae bacterium]